eukprot:s1576_g13.t1
MTRFASDQKPRKTLIFEFAMISFRKVRTKLRDQLQKKPYNIEPEHRLKHRQSVFSKNSILPKLASAS